ncbi:MAG TPA: ThuA domain-containing protein [Chryseolinea sp.]
MKRFFKISLWTILALVLLSGLFAAGFIYKIKNGFPVSFETDVPLIDFPDGKINVLLFSKSTAFRHGESIEAGKKVFEDLSKKNNWFLYSTEEGGVFNIEQLAKFHVVVFNNSTGRVLNDDQQTAFENYVEKGGRMIGIHGSGDDSHHWPWYVQNLVGSEFSHHPIDPQLQEAQVSLDQVQDSTIVQALPTTWTHTDEWYIFYENPRTKGFNIVYSIDGEKINPSGNILWMKDKNFGMGKDHPVAWYRTVGKGQMFYTSIGHSAEAWKQEPFVKMLENFVNAR